MPAIGDQISPREQVLYLLGELNVNYISLVSNITNKKKMPSVCFHVCILMNEKSYK